MASASDNPSGATPVPPRGGKRKPNRPPARPATAATAGKATSAGKATAAGKATTAGKPAGNRRAALAKERQRRQTLMAIGGVVVIIAVIGVFIGIKLSGGGTKSDTSQVPVAASTLDNFTNSVSLAALQAAANNYPLSSHNGAYPEVTKDPAITNTGKPELLYIGAEYCPYCATERWPMVLALSKFGTFHGLTTIHSNATDVYPNTATFSFYKSTYTSPYLTFTTVETEKVDKSPLQTLTAAQQAIFGKYSSSGSIPFVYFNGKAIISGAELDPSLLAGKSFQQIADQIAGQTTPLASSVTADAGAIVSDLCQMTGGQPGSVCKLFPKPITS